MTHRARGVRRHRRAVARASEEAMRPLAITLVLVCLASPSLADRTVRTVREDQPAAGLERIHVEFPVGRLVVEPSPDQRVHFVVQVRCKNDSRRCEERADEVIIDARRSGGMLRLDAERDGSWGTLGLTLHGVLQMPAELALRIKMGVGELTVEGLTDDVSVNLGVGKAKVWLREADVRSVDISSGVGDASLRVRRRSMEGSGWLGHHVRWNDGPGRAEVNVDLGVGEADVVLD